MRTAILKVQSLDECLTGFARAWKSGTPESVATIAFATPELMRDVLTPERWHLVKMLCGAGALSINEIAHRVGRDTDSLNADLTALIAAGIFERRKGGLIFPYEEVSLDLPIAGRLIVRSSKP